MELSISDPAGEALGWVNIGEPYGGQFPHPTDLSPWEHEVSDFGKFTELMTNSHTFAEDAFYGAAELLGMSPEQTCVTVRHAEPLDTGAVDPQLPYTEKARREYQRCFGINLCPKGDRMKLLEARAVIYPLENEWNGNSMVRANAEQKKQLAEEYAKSDIKEQNK